MAKFRKAVGAIILDKDGKILAFNRADHTESWQSVEGGIDEGEDPLTAICREVLEEINLPKEKFKILKETKKFIRYYFVNSIQRDGFVWHGQEKKFYLLKIIGDFNDFKYDNDPNQIEFRERRTMAADELLNKIPFFKKGMYKKVMKEFKLI